MLGAWKHRNRELRSRHHDLLQLPFDDDNACAMRWFVCLLVDSVEQFMGALLGRVQRPRLPVRSPQRRWRQLRPGCHALLRPRRWAWRRNDHVHNLASLRPLLHDHHRHAGNHDHDNGRPLRWQMRMEMVDVWKWRLVQAVELM